MNVRLYRRNFSDLAVQPDVIFTVDRYVHSTMGGPKTATIQASGKLEALFELVNHLREPIEIINDKGDCVWWGYISDLFINTDIGSYGVDLETMTNHVAVAYNDQDVRYTTPWSGDADSMAEYGIKELLLSRSDVTEANALQTRDVTLANSKHPIPVLKFSRGAEGTATINCIGWLNTLEWQYYQNLTGKEGYEEVGQGGREIGEDDRPKLAQSFKISSDTAWDATSIWLHVWYQGDNIPTTENLIVSLKADNSGVPGTTLASCSLAPSNFSERSEWVEFVMSNAVTLQPSTTYWIHVEKAGAIQLEKYYVVDTNLDAGYPRGVLYLYNTNLGSWGQDIYLWWGDLLFLVVGDVGTTDQISTLVSSCGQFFEDVMIEDVSGLTSNPYRDGDTAGLYELEKLLNAGTSTDRRLLCEVTRNRYLRVYEEPAKPDKAIDSYALSRDGQLLTAALTPIDTSLCPVGIWCHLHDVIPASVDLSLIADPTLFLIEEAAYDVQKGRYEIIATRNQANTLDIGGVVQG